MSSLCLFYQRGWTMAQEFSFCFLTVLQRVLLWAWSQFCSFSQQKSPLHNTSNGKAQRATEEKRPSKKCRCLTSSFSPVCVWGCNVIVCLKACSLISRCNLATVSHSVKWFYSVGGQSSGGVRLIFLMKGQPDLQMSCTWVRWNTDASDHCQNVS